MKTRMNWIEALVLALSAGAVLSALGMLAAEALTQNNGPPSLEVTLGETHPRADHTAIAVIVVNRGGETAEDVTVEVSLTQAPDAPLVARVSFPFVPKNSQRRGWVTFPGAPPGTADMAVHILSYRTP